MFVFGLYQNYYNIAALLTKLVLTIIESTSLARLAHLINSSK